MDLFTQARQLSESGAFNQPSLDAAEWTRLQQNASEEVQLAAYWYSDDSVQEWTELAEHKEAQDHVQDLETLTEPTPPADLLEDVLGDY